ncbi:MAG: PDZ domain-containing protein [candidate division KSB1 bacterium]|nr:PDZ domain-containing protein [candidate division KSB1 bacterium]
MKRFNSIWMIGLILFLIAVLTVSGAIQLMGAEKEAKKKGYLGVVTQELTRHQKKALKADFGVVITEIEPNSPAERDGLMEDDVIQWVNDVKITRSSTLVRVVRGLQPGEKAKIVVIRDGKEKTITVTIGRARRSESDMFFLPNPRNFFGGYRTNRAYLGVQLHEINEDLAQYFGVQAGEGVLILDVIKDSPAQKAGLKSGDVIVKIDGESVATPRDVQEIIAEYEEDDDVSFEIIRQNKKQSLTITLGTREDEESTIIIPKRMIREFRWRGNPERSIELWLPELLPEQKDQEIIIKKKVMTDSKQRI